jgi:putative oxidoreductase
MFNYVSGDPMRHLVRPPAAVRDVVLPTARVVLGVIFLAHGWQKLTEFGLGPTAQSFGQMGIPLPGLAAGFAAAVETVGGVALIVGAFTTVLSVLLVVDMLGAAVLVHLTHGVFVTDNGWELVGALGAGALVLAVTGAGCYSVDRLLHGRAAVATERQRETAHAG